jgi:hypothetical protein
VSQFSIFDFRFSIEDDMTASLARFDVAILVRRSRNRITPTAIGAASEAERATPLATSGRTRGRHDRCIQQARVKGVFNKW